ncbi:MAG TPA: hypothetical protein VNJ08_14605 [Bacteriovoracaceae bacterium]|nr:hypothetical protein [Bacteriovoracaceae bacterium]
MSTREPRQDKAGTKDFGKISVEEQKKLSRERIKAEESDETNEEIAGEAARKFDQHRSEPENFKPIEEDSGHL